MELGSKSSTLSKIHVFSLSPLPTRHFFPNADLGRGPPIPSPMSTKKRSGRRDWKDPWEELQMLGHTPSCCALLEWLFLKGVAGVQSELLTLLCARNGQMATCCTAEAQLLILETQSDTCDAYIILACWTLATPRRRHENQRITAYTGR